MVGRPGPHGADYVVFVHLMLPPDAVWAQHDRQPQDGAAHSTWQVGQVVQDDYTLTVPEDAPPGIYDIAVGIYDKDSLSGWAVNASDRPVAVARAWSHDDNSTIRRTMRPRRIG